MLFELFRVSDCVRCGKHGALLCDQCSRPTALRTRSDGLAWLAGAGYDPEMMRAVALWKDHGVTGLSRPFGRLLAGAICLSNWPVGELACMPARSASQRRRGWQPVADLAAATAAELGWRTTSALRWRRQPGDQRGLSDRLRRENLAAALEWTGGAGPVWLIDDVRTSGASLHAAASACCEAGVQVVAAAVLVSSRLPNR